MSAVKRWWSRWRARGARRAEVHGELRQLRQRVTNDVSRLRQLGLAVGLRSAQGGAVPWYAVLGDAQSGKSAALGELGLEPILPAAGGEPLAAPLAGWCSEQAVCWELSSQLLQPSPGGPDASSAVRELARWRPRLPLDGALVLLSVERLLTSPDDVRASSLQQLRLCLERLQEQLERELPIYLLLTKVDLLPGFAQLGAELDAAQRLAPWGASWHEREPSSGSFQARVAGEWAVLSRVLHARALRALHRSGGGTAAALFELSERFGELGQRLARDVHQLSDAHPSRPRLLLRGFYLCSSRPPCWQAQSAGWFFDGLLERAILPDRGCARLPARVLERESSRSRLQLGALSLSCALAIGPAVLSRSENLELIESTEQSLLREPAPELPGARSELGSELDALLPQLERLERAARRFWLRHWWGAYLAPELERQVARRYHERLQLVAAGPVREQLQAELRAIGDVSRFDWQNFRQAADTLKLYLMLTQPARLDAGWAAPRLLHSWQRARDRGACGGAAPLQPHIERWLRALKEDPSRAWPNDEALLTSVRSRLSSLPVAELGLAWLVERARHVPGVSAAQLFDASAAKTWNVPQAAFVPGVYTRAGWEQLRPALDEALFPAADAWIFARPLPAAWAREGVLQLHVRRHADAWRSFFRTSSAEARALPPGSPDVAWGQQRSLELIQSAALPDAPLARLFQLLARNVRFALDEPAALIGQAAGALSGQATSAPSGDGKALLQATLSAATPAPSALERELAGLLAFAFADEPGSEISARSALAEYQKELRELVASLQPAAAPPASASEPASTPLSRVAATVERLLAASSRADRELLEGWLLAPIEGGLRQLRLREQQQLSELWRARVVQPLRHLAERFPFRVAASEDADLGQLQALLAPGSGALWRLLEGELAPRVRELDGRFELVAGAEPRLSPAVLPCLSAARELREALFPADGAAVLVRLSSTGAGVTGSSLTVDGLKLEPPPGAPASAEHGWLELPWPGKGDPPGAALQLRVGPFTDELRRAGSFGWLRLLLEGGLHARGAGAGERGIWAASWQLQHGQTRVLAELRARGNARVPSLALFQELQCPAELFSSRPGGAP